MAAPNKPTILLVHGSYHTPTICASFLQALQQRGYETVCLQLPTADPKRLVADPQDPSFDQPPPAAGQATQADDAELIKQELKRLTEDEGKEVLLITHSSGGWSGTEASIPSFHRSTRSATNLPGGIIGIFHMASFLIKKDESVWSTFAAASNATTENQAWFKLNAQATLTTLTNPRHFFFHDIPESIDVNAIVAQLTACPFLASPLTNDVYGKLKIGYLVCEEDRVLPVQLQEGFIKVAEESGGKNVEVWRVKAGHEVFLSKEEEVIHAVEEFIQKCAL